MLEYQTIPKDPPSEITLNWQKLRDLGIRHLENLGAAIWTDFNIHDPGITILEVLCYAITDLGYRTSFPIEDLLAPKDSTEEHRDFFPAKDILPSHPVTEKDVREILIDTFVALEDYVTFDEGLRGKCTPAGPKALKRVIKNAWVNVGKVEDPRVFVWNRYEFSDLVYDKIRQIVENLIYRKEVHATFIFEDLLTEGIDSYRKELVNRATNIRNAIKDIFGQARFINSTYLEVNRNVESEDGSVQTINTTSHRAYSFDEIMDLISQYIGKQVGYNLSIVELRQISSLIYQGAELSYKQPEVSKIQLDLLDRTDEEEEEYREKFDKLLIDLEFNPEGDAKQEAACPLHIRGLYEVIVDLIDEIDPRDIDTVNGILHAIRERLQDNRSLAEDLWKISFVNTQPIGICAEIEIEESADMEAVEAEIHHSIQNFLTPTINFYSLQELQDEGYSCDQIFEGPKLIHGFLKPEELDGSPLRTEVHESDLTQVIMDVLGVTAVRYLQVFKCQGNKIIPEGIRESCIEMPLNHKPVLEFDCSEVHFKIGNMFTKNLELDNVKERLRLLNRIKKKPVPGRDSLEPLLPQGHYRDLDKYYSIQNLFPKTYRVGKEGVPNSATTERKAQAHQLKGYLLFFDQLLANYLEQLGEVRNLLSVEQDVTQPTYKVRAFTESEIPGLKDLLIEGQEKNASDEEDKFKMQKRRDQILNHLLARFGEKFTDYSILLLNSGISGNGQPIHKFKAFEEVLKEKATFLLEIPELGCNRARGFNYKLLKNGLPNVWDVIKAKQPTQKPEWPSTDPADPKPVQMSTDPDEEEETDIEPVDDEDQKDNETAPQIGNVSGLKRRVCKFMGFKDCIRSRISSTPGYRVQIDPEIVSGEIQFFNIKLVERQTGRTLLNGAKRYNLRQEAKAAAREIFNEALDIRKYAFLYNKKIFREIDTLIIGENIKEIQVVLKNFNGNIIAQSIFLNKENAINLRNQLWEIAFPSGKEGESNFHLLEHILLRPGGQQAFDLLQPFRITETALAVDPYSFWITVVAPKWHEQFADSNKRYFFEQIFRRETPAHIGLRFLYIDNMQMVELELPYKNWLEEKAKTKPNERLLANHQNQLVKILNQYKEVFPDTANLGRTELSCQQYIDRPLQKFE